MGALAHHETVVGPRSELEEALLIVEGEELDVDVAGRLVDGRRVPHDLAGVVQLRFRHDSHLVVAVGTAERQREREIKLGAVHIRRPQKFGLFGPPPLVNIPLTQPINTIICL